MKASRASCLTVAYARRIVNWAVFCGPCISDWQARGLIRPGGFISPVTGKTASEMIKDRDDFNRIVGE